LRRQAQSSEEQAREGGTSAFLLYRPAACFCTERHARPSPSALATLAKGCEGGAGEGWEGLGMAPGWPKTAPEDGAEETAQNRPSMERSDEISLKPVEAAISPQALETGPGPLGLPNIS